MSAPNSMIWRNAVAAASTVNLTGFVAGASPSSDTITGSSAAFVIDGYTALLNDRILLKDQTTASQDGIYTVTTLGSAASGTGPIATVGSTVAGSGYVTGTYTTVALNGGTGTGAQATLVVTGPGPINALGAVVQGTGYTSGQYVNQALTGGTGTGATATLLVQGGKVTFVTLVAPGTGYAVGDSLSATLTTTGPINVLGAITAGTLYTNGTYFNVPLTGGTGSGAKATVTVAGGAVTVVTLTAVGSGYTAGNSLSATAASLGGTGSGFAVAVTSVTTGSGFTVAVSAVLGTITTVTITSPGIGYTVADVLTVNNINVGGLGSGFHTAVATVTPSASVLTRASDAVTGSELQGLAVFVSNGTVSTNFAFVQVANPVVLNTTPLVFKRLSAL